LLLFSHQHVLIPHSFKPRLWAASSDFNTANIHVSLLRIACIGFVCGYTETLSLPDQVIDFRIILIAVKRPVTAISPDSDADVRPR